MTTKNPKRCGARKPERTFTIRQIGRYLRDFATIELARRYLASRGDGLGICATTTQARGTVKFKPLPAVWIVYQDGMACVWCTSKASAERYRNWGKRKVKHHINICRYELAGRTRK